MSSQDSQKDPNVKSQSASYSYDSSSITETNQKVENIMSPMPEKSPSSAKLEEMAEEKKEDMQFEGSKVLFVRRLPPDVKESQLMSLCEIWKPVKVLVLSAKHQAFIQFENEEEASKCLHEFKTSAPQIKGHTLMFHDANRSKIQFQSNTSHGPKKSLLITMTNVKYPVYADTLRIFFAERQMTLQKVIIFDKPFGKQALVELADVKEAERAYHQLDCKQLFTDGNFMRVQYSNFDNLRVNKHDELNRDYTVAHESEVQFQGVEEESKESSSKTQASDIKVMPNHFQSGAGPSSGRTIRPPPGFPSLKLQRDPGSTSSVNTPLTPSPFPQTSPYYYSIPFSSALSGQNKFSPLLRPYNSSLGNYNVYARNLSTRSAPFFPQYPVMPMDLTMPSSTSQDNKSSVVLVNNLSVDACITPKQLFNLFGIYGNVTKIKIMMKKKDTALVQFQEPHQAQIAKTYLNNCPMHDNKIKISPSKYPNIVPMSENHPPPPGQDKSYEDFTGSKQLRYKTQQSLYQKKVAYPCDTLHISNIALACYTDAQIVDLFKGVSQPEVVKFLQGGKDKKMALAKFKTTDDAVKIVMKFHNYRFMGRQGHVTEGT